MDLPKDRKYIETHEWSLLDGDVVVVGITDFAQDQLGDVVYVGDFEANVHLNAGDVAGVVESVKAASDIYAPISGQVIAVNEALTEAPELLNESPYTTWLFKIQPDNVADLDGLWDADTYLEQNS